MGSKGSKGSCYRADASPPDVPTCGCLRIPLSPSSACSSSGHTHAKVRDGEGPAPKTEAAPQRDQRKVIKRIKKQDTGECPEEQHLTAHRISVEKGPETTDLIKASMKEDRICAAMEEEELETVLDVMEPFQFEAGELIVEQGQPGKTFFVLVSGSAEVSVNGSVQNTLGMGRAFGGLAVLYDAPRTASVKASSRCCVWGANGDTIHRLLQENSLKNYAENREVIDSIKLFQGLSSDKKDRIGEACFSEKIVAGHRVITEGDSPTAVYFVKTGTLTVRKGGSVKTSGEYVGGSELSNLNPGDCFGERGVLHNEPRTATIIATGPAELLTITLSALQEVFGENLQRELERNMISHSLRNSPRYAQFSHEQQSEISKAMTVKEYGPGAGIELDFQFAIVLEGSANGMCADAPTVLERGHCFEDGKVLTLGGCAANLTRQPSAAALALENAQSLRSLVASKEAGARLAVLTAKDLSKVMRKLGLSLETPQEARDYARKMVVVRKVHIFRHLSDEQTNNLVKAFVASKYPKGTEVIKQGEAATSFFVIASGEVTVYIDGQKKRTMGKHAYLGERALLLTETRTATIKVSSNEAELWRVDKATFASVVKGQMQQDLMNRIRLQDTDVTLKDVKTIRVVGTGMAGVVRLVKHKKTGMRYALKRVKKTRGKVPNEVARECELLAENDHPFVITLVKVFETQKSIYMLQELLTGGELHDALRKIPTVLSRKQSQFYTGSLVIILEELGDRNIVYRDLKPENVMLDHQGYLKLIDFGIAKKLEEGRTKTFTLVGTPHYMAPEVMRGHGYGLEVDLWSLGIMLYEFVCGYLPFADDLDDPQEVCHKVLKEPLAFPSRYRDQPGRTLMQGLLCRQPKRRLGGLGRFEDIRSAEYFKIDPSSSSLFNKIMGRELEAPVQPKGETYCDTEEVMQAQASLSDEGELG